VGDRVGPKVYSIAAHRGFADALVAGLVPRYSDPELGLAKLTLLLPSARAARTISEAFIRHFGESRQQGMLMPRMAVVGDLDLDETLGSLLDPLGACEISPAADPMRRIFALVELLRAEMGEDAPPTSALLRLAREAAATMDRLLVENVSPDDLIGEPVLERLGDLAEHWQKSIRLFARVQQQWLVQLEQRGEVDGAARRNLLFERARNRWREAPPSTPIVAAGVTSAAPELAKMLRTIADLENGAVILPDLDLAMADTAWDELGAAGQSDDPGGLTFGRGDVLTHPQYHLKLLLNRMGVNRAEVRQWHRKGASAAPPERTHAISSLFLPPEASKVWVDLKPEKRRLAGVRLIKSQNSEEEAQAIAVLVRETLEEPEKTVAIITPDRGLARRVVQHLERWNIAADDSAGQPLHLTAAGRFLLQLAEVISDDVAPVALIAALAHPMVRRGEQRREWLEALRAFERKLRGPRPSGGFETLSIVARDAGVGDWWNEVTEILKPMAGGGDERSALADRTDSLTLAAEALAGGDLWAREDGRSLSRFLDEFRRNARDIGTHIENDELHAVLRDAMSEIAVRPPYGGHPRVAIYGLLESRMTRADLVLCGGLNEGTWPATPSTDPLLAPAILRALGVPGSEFRIGLSAHDLAGALGAPQVVLSRAVRDTDGPAIPSRFLLRIEALLGERADEHREERIPSIASNLDRIVARSEEYPRPQPDPSPALRDVPIKVTALDRLLGDPYQFYASEVLGLRGLDDLDADSTPAWQGTLAHDILQKWHEARVSNPKADIIAAAEKVFSEKNVHPLLRGLWSPRLFAALEWVAETIEAQQDREVVSVERKGSMKHKGVRVYGRADRIDRLADNSLAIIDYKTGIPPSASQVEAGFALQLGLLGLIARDGDFDGLSGDAVKFEYWSLARDKAGGFGFVDVPLNTGKKRSGLEPDEMLPATEVFLDQAISQFIKGTAPFTAKLNPNYPGYDQYDQLMRLEEWQIQLAENAEDNA